MRASQRDKAIPILESVVSQAPFATEPYTMLADARIAVGRVDEAVSALERPPSWTHGDTLRWVNCTNGWASGQRLPRRMATACRRYAPRAGTADAIGWCVAQRR